MLILCRKFLADKRGLSSVEYALVASLIAIIAIVGAKNLGNSTNTKLVNISNSVKTP